MICYSVHREWHRVVLPFLDRLQGKLSQDLEQDVPASLSPQTWAHLEVISSGCELLGSPPCSVGGSAAGSGSFCHGAGPGWSAAQCFYCHTQNTRVWLYSQLQNAWRRYSIWSRYCFLLGMFSSHRVVSCERSCILLKDEPFCEAGRVSCCLLLCLYTFVRLG